MNSLFTPAPFSRFEMKKHAMGQDCPIGTAPFNNNGVITCQKASPPSGMFMPPAPSGNVGYGAAMGQPGPSPYLTQAERDQLILQIQDAFSKVQPLENFIAWSDANDPGLKKYLGLDSSRFFTLAGVVAPLYSTVANMYERLQDTDAEGWWRPSDIESAEVKQWAIGINEMYKILKAHPTPAFALPPGSQTPPSIFVVPVNAVGGGALTGGLSAGSVLLGAGLLAGLGAIAYAIFG